ncbi:MAG TPA: MFS transporter [Steroidobacteraceae bacterium]|nr:MFS transporter [Steroidobacteraceae bacterium]
MPPSEPTGRLDPSVRYSAPVDRRSAILAASTLYAVTFTLPNVMPALVGILADTAHFSGKHLGSVAAAYPLGLGFMALSSFVWIRRVNFRLCIATGVLVLAAAVGLQKWWTDFDHVLTLMFVAGLGGGLAASPCLTVLGDGHDPQKNFGVMILISVLLPASALALMTTITGRLGDSGVFIFLAGLFALSLPLALLIPKGGRVTSSAASRAPCRSTGAPAPAAISLTSMIPFVAGYIAAWTFLERMGALSSLAHEWILDSLALSGLVGGLGGFVATWMSRRLQLRPALLLAIGATILTLAFLVIFRSSPVSYLLLVTSFQLWVNVNFSNIMTFIALEDRAGHLVGLIPSLQCFGASLGSVVAGVAFDGAGRWGVVAVAVTAFLLSAGLMVAAFGSARARTESA